MDWSLVVTLIIVSIATAIFALFKYQYTYWKIRGIPHIEPEFPYGNLKTYGKSEHPTQIYKRIYDRFKDKSPFSGAYFAITPVAIITDLDLIRNILIKDFSYFVNRGFYYNSRDDPLSAHMFALDGDEWKRIRSKFTPSFTVAKMKFTFPTIMQVNENFIKVLSKAVAETNVFEIKEYLARYTTDVIGSCAFGIECNSLENPNSEFRQVGRKVFDEPRHSKFVQLFMSQLPHLCRFLRIKVLSERVSTFFMGVVEQIVKQRETNNIHRNDFMDLLIDMKNSSQEDKKITMNELGAQALVFFLAGFETSSTTMTFILYELALNQELQEKARQEVFDVLKKHNDELTYEAMMEMTYIEQIATEALRKYPPLALLARCAIKDYPVPGTDKIIEKGTSVFIPGYTIHHDPKIYPNPEVFDPDRFNPEEVKKRHPMSFLAFGDGPRNCIGLRFGIMQTRVGVISLLRKFRFKCCPQTINPMKFSMKSLILTPNEGLWLQTEEI